MITTAMILGQPRLALAVPEICTYERVAELRDGLLDILETCLRDEESKEAVNSLSVFMVLRMIRELNRDLDRDPDLEPYKNLP